MEFSLAAFHSNIRILLKYTNKYDYKRLYVAMKESSTDSYELLTANIFTAYVYVCVRVCVWIAAELRAVYGTRWSKVTSVPQMVCCCWPRTWRYNSRAVRQQQAHTRAHTYASTKKSTMSCDGASHLCIVDNELVSFGSFAYFNVFWMCAMRLSISYTHRLLRSTAEILSFLKYQSICS